MTYPKKKEIDKKAEREKVMDIRDEFAIRIMQGMLSNSWIQREFKKDIKNLNREAEFDPGAISAYMRNFHSDTAYKWADAMLEFRDKKK